MLLFPALTLELKLPFCSLCLCFPVSCIFSHGVIFWPVTAVQFARCQKKTFQVQQKWPASRMLCALISFFCIFCKPHNFPTRWNRCNKFSALAFVKGFHSHKFSAVSGQTFPGETRAYITVKAMNGTCWPMAIPPAFILNARHLELQRIDHYNRYKNEQGRWQWNTFTSAVLRYRASSVFPPDYRNKEVFVNIKVVGKHSYISLYTEEWVG